MRMKSLLLGVALLTSGIFTVEARAGCRGHGNAMGRPRVFGRVLRAVVRAPARVFAERRARLQYRRSSSCQ